MAPATSGGQEAAVARRCGTRLATRSPTSEKWVGTSSRALPFTPVQWRKRRLGLSRGRGRRGCGQSGDGGGARFGCGAGRAHIACPLCHATHPCVLPMGRYVPSETPPRPSGDRGDRHGRGGGAGGGRMQPRALHPLAHQGQGHSPVQQSGAPDPIVLTPQGRGGAAPPGSRYGDVLWWAVDVVQRCFVVESHCVPLYGVGWLLVLALSLFLIPVRS